MPSDTGQLCGAARLAGPSRVEQLHELAVFLLLIVPSMVLSFFAIRTGTLGFVITAVATILRDVGLVALVLFFLWRNGESRERIGWVFRRHWSDVLLGGALFVLLSSGISVVDLLLGMLGLTEPSTQLPNFLDPAGDLQLVLAVALVAVVAVAEETVFRGYLIHRILALTGSRAAAVVLSSLLFALGHGYEGTAGVITVGLMGLFFALAYLWRGSLVAPITMHFIQDFASIVLLPLWKTHGGGL